jgi:hypothetical protein
LLLLDFALVVVSILGFVSFSVDFALYPVFARFPSRSLRYRPQRQDIANQYGQGQGKSEESSSGSAGAPQADALEKIWHSSARHWGVCWTNTIATIATDDQ